MSKRRLFSDTIVESDAFLDMPLTAQALYFHLCMNADNDGFMNPKRVMRMIGAAHDDLQILLAKRFILSFDSGVVVVKHWWINNLLRKDRYTPTTYTAELAQLGLKTNKSYTKNTTQMALDTEVDDGSATKRQPNGNQRVPQHNVTERNITELNLTKTNRLQVFKKSENLDKAAYAKAVKADEALEQKEQHATNRPKGYDTFAKAGELLKRRKFKGKSA